MKIIKLLLNVNVILLVMMIVSSILSKGDYMFGFLTGWFLIMSILTYINYKEEK